MTLEPASVLALFDIAAGIADAQHKVAVALGSGETVNTSVTRQLSTMGITAWNVGIVAEAGHVVLLLSSTDQRIKAWNLRYAAADWGRDDPVTVWGRGTGGIIPLEAIPGIDAPDVASIATARRAAGLTGGLVIPWRDGGYASAFGFTPAALADPGDPERIAAVTLLRWLAVAGDFSNAARFNRSGLVATPLEAAVCRGRLAGKTYDMMVADGEIGSVSAGAKALTRLKSKLTAAGLLADDAPSSSVPETAWRYGLFQTGG